MTADGWKFAILEAISRAAAGDESLLDGLAECLAEEDQAKQLLRNAGYGYTGMSLLRSVQEVIASHADA